MKKYHEKYTGEFEEKVPLWIKLRPWVFSLLGVAVFAATCLIIYNTGLKKPDTSILRSSDDSEAQKISEEISALEKIYTDSLEAELITKEARESLKLALEKQKYLLSNFPNQNSDQIVRFDRLERAHAAENAKAKSFDIRRHKENGDEAVAQKKIDIAIREYQAALDLQKEINGSQASAKLKNFGNESLFARTIETLKAEPVAKERDEAEAAALQAIQSKHWQDARTAYTTAHRLQLVINQNYNRTRFSDPARASRLNVEIISLKAAPEADAIREKEETGDKLLSEGNYIEAAKLFETARAMQLKLNTDHPRSRFVTSERVEELETKQQTALSAPLVDQLPPLDKAIIAALAAKQFDNARQIIGQAAAILERLSADYPKSQRLDSNLRLKFAYLGVRGDKLPQIEEAVTTLLAPLPADAKLLMLKCEVPQTLYDLVMGTNPSRNPGRTLPVDSITWNETQEFCTRLTWVLGRTVRLPVEKEFYNALSVETPGSIVTKSNTQNRRSRDSLAGEPNANGFYNLLGNLSEWIDAEKNSENAQHIGGSYLDDETAVLKVPLISAAKRDRFRNVGFRFIVEPAQN